MVKPHSVTIRRILEPEMRKLFNDGRYFERVQTGELKAVLMEDRPAPPAADQPPGTRSQMISYRDASDKEIARVHQYLKADGTLGASRKPDPKRLLINDTLFRLTKAKDRQEPPTALD